MFSAFQTHLKSTAVITAIAIHMFYRAYKNPGLAGLIDQPLPFAVLQMGGMLQVGARVLHVLRGPGHVVAINEADSRRKPFVVAFESGETHQYSKESVTKLVILSKAREAANASSLLDVGMRVMHEQRGSGKCIEINLAEPRGKPYYIEFDNGEVHHYSQDSVMKLRVLGKGAKVWHPMHGAGTLVEVNPADVRRRPYHVLFENGERHTYSSESAMKLQIRKLLVPPPKRIITAPSASLVHSAGDDSHSPQLPTVNYASGNDVEGTGGAAGAEVAGHKSPWLSTITPERMPPAAPRHRQRKARRESSQTDEPIAAEDAPAGLTPDADVVPRYDSDAIDAVVEDHPCEASDAATSLLDPAGPTAPRSQRNPSLDSADDAAASAADVCVAMDVTANSQKEACAEVKAVWVPSAVGEGSKGRIELRASPARMRLPERGVQGRSELHGTGVVEAGPL